jgi:hypothetical protein
MMILETSNRGTVQSSHPECQLLSRFKSGPTSWPLPVISTEMTGISEALMTMFHSLRLLYWGRRRRNKSPIIATPLAAP